MLETLSVLYVFAIVVLFKKKTAHSMYGVNEGASLRKVDEFLDP